jgi:NAD(P)-dependent dehydrogenase (short-subunit alcohol dehydrogenase family)
VSASARGLGLPPAGVAFVVNSGVAVGRELAVGLEQGGSRVALLHDVVRATGPESITRSGSVVSFPTSFASRDEVAAQFAAAASQLGPPQLVVQSILPPSLLTPSAIGKLELPEWTDAVHGAARATFYGLQAAHAQMTQSGGGAIVCVGPSFGLVGAAGLVALSTVLEAQRTLVKSAARQWGHLGIRVHWISLGVGENYPALQGISLPNAPELGPPPPALGRVPDLSQDVASIAQFLASHAGRALTGTSLVADGGVWMVP